MKATRGRLLFAFITLYLVWGSSYLAIRYAVETLPPLAMAGSRFLIAGIVLFAICRALGVALPTRGQWRSGAIVGAALMSSNATVAWSERRIASGVASLIVAVTPCFMVSIDAFRQRVRPRAGVLFGLAAGLIGIAVLIGPSQLVGGSTVDLAGALAVLAGTLAWTIGSLHARDADRPSSPFMLSAIQMIAGGAILVPLSFVFGEWRDFSLSQVSTTSWYAFIYLIALPSLAGYTSYLYVLTNASPARASTYAYVNPIVAVALGAMIGGEPLTSRVVTAATIIILAVILIVSSGSRSTSRPGDGAATSASDPV
jgi:drug/metabolite transporter (DMT)-like permease